MMFKIFLKQHPTEGQRFEILMNIRSADFIGTERCTKPANPNGGGRWSLIYFAPLILLLCTCCRTLPQLPKANFKEPGWKVREGQAVWTLPHHKDEVAGDVLVATRTEDSRSFVQFSKTP